ncbi:NAD(P)-binding protein [Aulographum hederae CBS 113979]|uniref:NAD(P)-binding protein n=1 Tax=Aulographum hederae CBS 113979 TaxID=1176131 RepID=A0A6G1H6A7_9PEZI|nr:NAD(P)-binding protein [Aulographum hederae CBS 113979]
MKVFVTGATGFIGSAVVPVLLKAGHTVLGLSRSDTGADALRAQGAEVHRGSLDDLESLKQGALASDGVIHLAFGHDFSKFAELCAADRAAIQTMGDALAGTDKPLIVTSGTLMIASAEKADEDTQPDFSHPMAAARGQSETLTLELAKKGVRASVIRCSPTMHGDGDKGFIPMLIDIAREKGVSAYIGDGANVWPACHVKDGATAYVLAVEKGKAGSMFHAVADEAVSTKDMAVVIGEKLGVPVKSLTMEEAQAHFGFMSFPFSGNNPVSSAKTREQLGWKPVECSLLDDMKNGTYFDDGAKSKISR